MYCLPSNKRRRFSIIKVRYIIVRNSLDTWCKPRISLHDTVTSTNFLMKGLNRNLRTVGLITFYSGSFCTCGVGLKRASENIVKYPCATLILLFVYLVACRWKLLISETGAPHVQKHLILEELNQSG